MSALLFNVTSYIFNIMYTIYTTVSQKLNITYPSVKLYRTVDKFYDYDILIDNKYHRITFINSTIDFNNIISKKHLFLNTILNCTITFNDKVIDFTKEMKQFYHNIYQVNVKWSDFFDYCLLNNKHKTLIIKNEYIHITLNDDELTMYDNKISDILEKNFYFHDVDIIKKLY